MNRLGDQTTPKLKNHQFNKTIKNSTQQTASPASTTLQVPLPPPTTTATTPTTTTATNQSTNPLRLLIKKLVFLDLNTTYKHLNKLKECLITIGVNIADCLSKDVNYVITNRVKYEDLKLPASTSNESICDLNKISATPKKTSPTIAFSRVGAINRTQAILEKASKGNVCTDVLTSARRLGISIMHIIEIEKYVEKYMFKSKLLTNNPNTVNTTSKDQNNLISNNCVNNKNKKLVDHDLVQHIIESTNNNVRKLKSPYLKFESVCKQYKPNYQEFKQWHDVILDLNIKNNHSPFQIYFSEEIKDDSSTSTHNQNDLSKVSKKTPTTTGTLQQLQNLSATQTQLSTTQTTNINCTLNSSKAGSYLSSIFDTHVTSSQQQQQTVSKTSLLTRTNSTVSNTSSVHQSLSRHSICTTTATTTTKLYFQQQTSQQLQTKQSPNVAKEAAAKRKVGGYCECCKLRYDNLKQHLTSLQHENFEKNQNNFKELDSYINSCLNFESFIKSIKDKRKKDVESNKENVIVEEVTNEVCVEVNGMNEVEEQKVNDDFNEKTIIEENIPEADNIAEKQQVVADTIESVEIVTNGMEISESRVENIQLISESTVDSVVSLPQPKKKVSKKASTNEIDRIDRLIYESQSLGQKKSDKRRSNAMTKYIELTNKDFNILLTTGNSFDDAAITTTTATTKTKSKKESTTIFKPLSKAKKSSTVPNDLNEIANGNNKSIKRKRKLTPDKQQNKNFDSINQENKINDEKKPILKLKLARNRSNNNWQVSSSSNLVESTAPQQMDTLEKAEIDKQFDNALLELVKECENENEEISLSQKIETVVLSSTVEVKEKNNEPDLIGNQNSKRPRLVNSPEKVEIIQPNVQPKPFPPIQQQQQPQPQQSNFQLPSFQTLRPPPPAYIPVNKPLFNQQQLHSLNAQILAAQQLSNFCIYMAPPPPLPPILPPMYHPTPFYIPPQPQPPPPQQQQKQQQVPQNPFIQQSEQNSVLNKYTANMAKNGLIYNNNNNNNINNNNNNQYYQQKTIQQQQQQPQQINTNIKNLTNYQLFNNLNQPPSQPSTLLTNLNNNTKHTTNLFDTLSAANTLINNL